MDDGWHQARLRIRRIELAQRLRPVRAARHNTGHQGCGDLRRRFGARRWRWVEPLYYPFEGQSWTKTRFAKTTELRSIGAFPTFGFNKVQGHVKFANRNRTQALVAEIQVDDRPFRGIAARPGQG